MDHKTLLKKLEETLSQWESSRREKRHEISLRVVDIVRSGDLSIVENAIFPERWESIIA
jgi:hypothetical protein